jgi:hypothetical protein
MHSISSKHLSFDTKTPRHQDTKELSFSAEAGNLTVSLGVFVALCLGVAGTVQNVFTQSASRPNIIFIMADDLGYGDIGAFGQQLIQTPSLDKMAEEGATASSTISNSRTSPLPRFSRRPVMLRTGRSEFKR